LVESQIVRGYDVHYVSSDWSGNPHTHSLKTFQSLDNATSSLLIVNSVEPGGRVTVRGNKVTGVIFVNLEPVGACLPVSLLWKRQVQQIDVGLQHRHYCGKLGEVSQIKTPIVSHIKDGFVPQSDLDGIMENLTVSMVEIFTPELWLQYAQLFSLPFSTYYSYEFLKLHRE